MKRPVTYIFNSPSVTTDITGKIPDWCTYRIPYAIAEQTLIKEGIIISQFYSHILFFMEVVEIDLREDLEASYLIENPSLFLFMMLKGGVRFLTPDGKLIAEAPEDICYATYNKAGEYLFHLPKGRYRLCYLCPRPIWIIKYLKRYPRLKPFMESMQHSDELFGHMPACAMDDDMKRRLEQMFHIEEIEGTDLEAILTKEGKVVIDHYQRLLDDKFAQRPYRIKDFLEENFADSSLDNIALARTFSISEKTMIDDFKEEFGTTPYHYLIHVRMEHAKRMLNIDKMQAKDVYIKVGYRDLHSFQAQYKKSNENRPSDGFKRHFLPFFWAF